MIFETTINLKNKSKEELLDLLNDSLKIIQSQQEEIKLSNKVIDKRNAEKLELVTSNLNKSKIIKEMSIFMANSDIDEEICKHQVATFCDDKPEGVTLDVCAKCIEKYFKKKVENDN